MLWDTTAYSTALLGDRTLVVRRMTTVFSGATIHWLVEVKLGEGPQGAVY